MRRAASPRAARSPRRARRAPRAARLPTARARAPRAQAAEYSAHEYVLMAVMLDDPKHALDNVAGACGRGWLHCHLEGLLSHAGQVEPRPPGALGCTDHELSVIEYARSLGGSRGLWQLGVDYLRALPYEVAWPWVCALVRAEEPAPDAKAERLLDVCAAWQLDDAAASVCTQLVARKLRARMPAAALGWFARTPEPWRVRARHDAIARALVRACEDPAAPGEDGSAAPPAKALARALAGLGGTASLRSLPESSWLVGYCQLREGLEQLAQRKGLTGAHAAARAAGHGAGGGMDVDGAAAAPPVPAAPAEAAALEAEVRRLLLELCAASPAHGAAGASALPQRVQSQLLLEAHAAGMLEVSRSVGRRAGAPCATGKTARASPALPPPPHTRALTPCPSAPACARAAAPRAAGRLGRPRDGRGVRTDRLRARPARARRQRTTAKRRAAAGEPRAVLRPRHGDPRTAAGRRERLGRHLRRGLARGGAPAEAWGSGDASCVAESDHSVLTLYW